MLRAKLPAGACPLIIFTQASHHSNASPSRYSSKPVTVLSCWQERNRQWKDLGIDSGRGRDEALLGQGMARLAAGTTLTGTRGCVSTPGCPPCDVLSDGMHSMCAVLQARVSSTPRCVSRPTRGSRRAPVARHAATTAPSSCSTRSPAARCAAQHCRFQASSQRCMHCTHALHT